MAQECVADGQALGRLERARLAAAEGEGLRPRDVGGERHELARSRPSARPAARRRGTIRASRIRARAAAPRSRLRKTWASAKICVSPAASSFFIANSGEVWSQASRGAPSGPTRPARSPCRWVSLPGEACRAAGSTSTKPWASNQRRIAAAMRGAQDEPRAPGGVAVAAPEGRRAQAAQGAPEVAVESRAMPSGLCRRNQYKARRHRRDAALKSARPFAHPARAPISSRTRS